MEDSPNQDPPNQEPRPVEPKPPPKKKKRKNVRKSGRVKETEYSRLTPEQKEKHKQTRRNKHGVAYVLPGKTKQRRKKQALTKCTPEVIKILSQCFLIGSDVVIATAMAGIHKQTFYDWMRIAQQKEYHPNKEACIKFRNTMLEHVAKCSMKDLNTIDKFAVGRDRVYERYPPGYVNIETGEDLGGQIRLDDEGKPIVIKTGIVPDWKAAAWRLGKRAPSVWGDSAAGSVFADVTGEVNRETGEGGSGVTLNIQFVKSERKDDDYFGGIFGEGINDKDNAKPKTIPKGDSQKNN